MPVSSKRDVRVNARWRAAKVVIVSLIVLDTWWPACCPALAGRPPEAPTDYLPNVVLIGIDTLRADHLGCYGYGRPTSPNIDRLASEGILFENCYTAASWTLPSFMSVFTGLMPSSHGIVRENLMLSPAIPTLPEEFRSVGYYCGGVVSCPFAEAKYGFDRGFHVYDDFSVLLAIEIGKNVSPDYKRHLCSVSDVRTSSDAIQYAKLILQSGKRSGRPVFLFMHLFDPHGSYIPPSPYNNMFDPDYLGPINGRNLAAMKRSPLFGRDLRHLVSLYDGEIAYTDALIGGLIDEIDQALDPQKTIIVLFSDHGEAFAEHGLLQHGNSAYREEAIVPMIWRWPGVLPKGRRITTPVSSIDTTRTLKELLGFERMKILQGEDLWPMMFGRISDRHGCALTQKANGIDRTGYHMALTRGNFRLHIRFRRNPEDRGTAYEFYDVISDPWEQEDLAVSDDPPSEMTQMREILLRKWQECVEIQQYYRKAGSDREVDLTDGDKRRLRSMGYLK